MAIWSKDELRALAGTDDLHIAPFREDGATYGTPTWILRPGPDGSTSRGERWTIAPRHPRRLIRRS